LKPDYPEFSEAAAVSNLAQFKELYGIFGKHRYTIAVCQHLTKCFYAINRHGVAIKCLNKTLALLKATLEEGPNKLHSAQMWIDQVLTKE